MIYTLAKRVALALALWLCAPLMAAAAENTFVGATAGSVGVSPTGAATYQIPLVVPPSMNGIQPNLSIAYSSQAGSGLLGYGFSLTGLSSITRAAMPYPDGKFKTIGMDNNDTYALDGQLLHKPVLLFEKYRNPITLAPMRDWNSSCGHYYTEYETFNKIESFGYTGYGPMYFIVTTKDGTVMEYGRTEDSRVKVLDADGNERILEWKLNKVTKDEWQEMTYTYTTVEGDVVLQKITYTKTPFIDACNSVNFEYQARGESNFRYEGGVYVPHNRALLKRIRIRVGSQLIREYTPTYAKDQLQHRMTSLQENIYVGDSKTTLTTSFKWDRQAGLNGAMNIPDTNVKNIYFVDLDGDGKDEMVKLYNKFSNPYKHTCKIFKLNGLNNPTLQKQFVFEYGSNLYLNFADVNGDGLTDILDAQLEDYGTKLDFGLKDWPYIGICFNQGNFNFQFEPNQLAYGSPGNFLGNGKTTFSVAYGDNGKNTKIRHTSFPLERIPTPSTYNYKHTYTAGVVNIGDFDGNGKDDLLVIKWKEKLFHSPTYSSRIRFFDNGGEGELEAGKEFSTNSIFGKKAEKFYSVGDFNGDGKADALTWDKNEKQWAISYANGESYNGPFSLDVLSPNEVEYVNENGKTENIKEYNKVYVCDLNGDGKSDLLEVAYGNVGREGLWCKAHISTGALRGFITEEKRLPITNKNYTLQIANPNGDGISHIFISDNINSSGTWLTFGTNAQPYVTGIIDNMGTEQKIAYTVSPKNYGGFLPNIGLGAPLRVVSSIQMPNATGGYNEVRYTFEEPKTNANRKAFFGFAKVTTENVAQKTKVVSQSSYSPTLGLLPLYTYSYVDGEQVAYADQGYATSVRSYRGLPMVQVRFAYSIDNLTGNTEDIGYSYDSYGNLTGQTNYTYNIGHDDFTYTETSYTGWVVRQSFVPNKAQTVTTKVTRNGQTHTETATAQYDEYGRTTQAVANGITTKYVYDAPFSHGQLIWQTTTAADVAEPIRQSYTYDDYGRYVVRKETGTNEILSETYRYNDLGQVTLHTGTDGRSTGYAYDALGREVSRTLHNGQKLTTQIAKESNGGAAYSISTYGQGVGSTKTYYDVLGREVKTSTLGKGDKYVTTEKRYNARGQLEKIISPDALGGTQEVTYIYDKYGRLEREVSPTAAISYSYSGNTLTTTNETTGRTASRTTNVQGQVLTATDNSGTVSYAYNVRGLPTAVTVTTGGSSVVTTMGYDAHGYQTRLSDPTGIMTYKYNTFGQLLEQTDAEGNTTTMQYDEHGRVVEKHLTAGLSSSLPLGEGQGGAAISCHCGLDPQSSTTAYTYAYKKGRLSTVKQDGTTVKEYSYTRDGLLTKEVEHVGKQKFEHAYTYNNMEQLTAITYPSGLKVGYGYDGIGNLTTIAGDKKTLWHRPAYNSAQQLTAYSLGNGTEATLDYTKEGLLRNMSTYAPSGSRLHKQEYEFNPITGNLTSRTFDGKKENFTYDNLDRLTGWGAGCHPEPVEGCSAAVYAPNGNLTTKTDVGTFAYNQADAGYTANPYAVTSIDTHLDTLQSQHITYNAIGKVATIAQGADSLAICYGPEGQRNRMEHYRNKLLLRTHYYSGGFERQVEADGAFRDFQYLSAESGMFAVYEKPNKGTAQWWYLHTDHLGSPTLVTDKFGQIYEQHRYDAWGLRLTPQGRFSRGYTGHEHILSPFGGDGGGMINMNGRVYDPLLGRMLSPDPYVVSPDFAQDYNRYTYARNNPLIYTDPDGEWVWLIPVAIGAIVGGYTGHQIGEANGATGWNMFGYIMGGAAIGGAAGYAGFTAATTASASALASGATAMEASMVGGFMGGAAAGSVNGFGMTLLAGGNIGDAMGGMMQGMAVGGASGLAGGAAFQGMENLLNKTFTFNIYKWNFAIQPFKMLPTNTLSYMAGSTASQMTANLMTGQNLFKGVDYGVNLGLLFPLAIDAATYSLRFNKYMAKKHHPNLEVKGVGSSKTTVMPNGDLRLDQVLYTQEYYSENLSIEGGGKPILIELAGKPKPLRSEWVNSPFIPNYRGSIFSIFNSLSIRR